MKKALMTSAVLGLTALTSAPALADITVENCVIREPAPGMKMTAAYLDLNYIYDDKVKALRLPAPEALQVANIPALSDKVQVHMSSMKDGVMSMKQIPRFRLKPGKNQLKPGGAHIMIMNMKETPKAGDVYPVEIWFSFNDTLTCDAVVKTSAEIAEMYK